MPIINLEYTDNLKIDDQVKLFLLEIHHILVEEIKTDLKTCRSTISKANNYVIGDNDPRHAFIILRIQMLPGRTDAIKHQTGKRLLQKIYADFSEIFQHYNTQVRVQLTDVDKNYYYGLE